MPDPRILDFVATSANDDLFNKAIRHAVLLERLKASEVKRVVSFLDEKVIPDIIGRIETSLARSAARGITRSTASTKALQELLASTTRVLGSGMRLIGNDSVATLKKLGLSEADWQKAAVDAASPVNLGFKVPSPTLLRQIIVDQPVRGRLLKEWYTDIGRNAQRGIKDAINIGLAQGDSVQQIVSRIRGKGGALKLARTQAASITRTAVNHVSSRAREMTYAANKDVIKGVRFVSTLDARTSDICISLDGKVFKVGEGPRPPMHHQCRSTTVPIVKSWKELGLDLKKAPPGTRASLNGQVPNKIKYPAWLRKQSKATQIEALGTKRANLFRQGRMTLTKDLVDQTDRPLTLGQINKKEGIRAPQAANPLKPETIKTADDVRSLPGWSVKESTTPKGALVRTFISPEGKKFRSVKQVRAALADQPVIVPPPPPPPPVLPPPTVIKTLDDVKALKGWEVRETTTPKGRLVRTFVSPTGQKFRSVKEVARFLGETRGTETVAKAVAKVKTPTIKRGSQIREEMLAIYEERDNVIAAKRRQIKILNEEVSAIRYRPEFNHPTQIRRRAIYAQIQELNSEIRAISKDFTDLHKLMELPVGLRTTTKINVIKGRKGLTHGSTIRGLGPTSAKKAREAERFLSSLISKEVMPEFKVNANRNRGNRANASATGINMSTRDPVRVWVHEMGHALESEATIGNSSRVRAAKKKILDRSLLFLKNRAKADPKGLRPLNEIRGNRGYDFHERAWEDKFLSAYMGKDYSGRATEILSMGLEYLFADPVRFAKADPEMFDFILDTIRGFL